MSMKIAGIIISSFVLTVGSVFAQPEKADTTKPEAPVVKMSDIPSITTPDRTPLGCVNCHANYVKMNRDFRLTAILAGWREMSDSDIVVKARAAAPKGLVIQGKHPDVSSKVKIIPTDCLKCHARDSKKAPPFSRLLHAIHLTGKEENGFLTRANGTCTSCHKLDEKTGSWGLGSGQEIEK